MDGKPTAGLRERGHYIGEGTRALLDRKTAALEGMVAQARAALDDNDTGGASVALRAVGERLKDLYHLSFHAMWCDRELPCQCHHCTTSDERREAIRKEIESFTAEGMHAYAQRMKPPEVA